MPDVVERLRPGHLISLLPAQEQPATPFQVQASEHLRMLVDDIDRPAVGQTVPASNHIEELIRFLRACSPRSSIVIHCLAGMSRSPAAALIALALEAPGRELEAARLLREAGPSVDPNRLVVELADRALRREGALVAALEAMGAAKAPLNMKPLVLPRAL